MRSAARAEPAFIGEILKDSFGESDPERIRRRRAHRFLEICTENLQAFVEAIRDGRRPRALHTMDRFAFAFKSAIASLRVSLGPDVTQHYTDDFDAMLGRIAGIWEVKKTGRSVGVVRAGIVPFDPAIPTEDWRLFLEQHREELVSVSLRQAERLARLMHEVWPEAAFVPAGRKDRATRRMRRRSTSDETLAQAKGLWAEHPDWSKTRLATALGVSRETLSRPPYKEALAEFRAELNRVVAAPRTTIDPRECMGDDEWGSMTVQARP